jgi:hypothetical protein
MAHRHSKEFRREAVCIALTSGLTRKQVASEAVRLPLFRSSDIVSPQLFQRDAPGVDRGRCSLASDTWV